QPLFRGRLRLGGLRGTGRLRADCGGRHREEKEEAKRKTSERLHETSCLGPGDSAGEGSGACCPTNQMIRICGSGVRNSIRVMPPSRASARGREARAVFGSAGAGNVGALSRAGPAGTGAEAIAGKTA